MSEKPKLILIVEDDELTRQALAEGMAQANFEVIYAENGEDGLKTALAKKPDLILLDLMMPRMDGHEMLAKLREDKWGADVPVIVLTNADDNLDIFKATTQGATGYAVKSNMKMEEIVNLVKGRLKTDGQKS